MLRRAHIGSAILTLGFCSLAGMLGCGDDTEAYEPVDLGVGGAAAADGDAGNGGGAGRGGSGAGAAGGAGRGGTGGAGRGGSSGSGGLGLLVPEFGQPSTRRFVVLADE